MNIHADASRRNRYSFGGGYATDTGVRGTLGCEDRRINKLGHSFQRRGPGRAGDQVQPADPLHHPDRRPGGGELQPACLGRTARLGRRHHQHPVGGTGHHDGHRQLAVRWLINAVRTASETIDPTLNATDHLLVPELDIASVPKGYLGEPLFEHPLFIVIRGSHSRARLEFQLAAGARPGRARVRHRAEVAPAAAR